MKAFFESNNRQAIKSEHRHDAHLDGQMVAIDCDRKKQVVRIDLYKKGQQSYYCGLWIMGQTERELDVMGSSKANNRFDAVYGARKRRHLFRSPATRTWTLFRSSSLGQTRTRHPSNR